MEIKLNKIDSKKLLDINISFKQREITSVLSSKEEEKIELLDIIALLEQINNGQITYGRKKIDKSSTTSKKKEISKDIYYLNHNYKDMLFNINIKDDIKFYLGDYDKKELNEILNDFNLDSKILEKNYIDLSSSEIRKILIIICILSNCKILVLNEPTLFLDNKSIKTLIKYLKLMKREEKIIILTSNNTNFLLEISDRIIKINNKKVVQEGTKYEILLDDKILKKVNLKKPEILNFINKIRTLKNIRISNTDNINDLIKDIYRHAK